MKSFKGKTLLITGGTGSFGQKFVRLALDQFNLARIIVFSRDELKQFEMARAFADDRLKFFLGDVRDKDRVYEAMQGVDFVVHAAAMKQVPAAERHPDEAIKTNILGAVNVIGAALNQGVSKVITLSTDKAAHPVNLYGATKMVAEKLLITANTLRGQEGTRFSVVRYGNVAGSRGSVIPVFLKQRETGVLTLTHPEMTRFWITLEQGTCFVARSLAQMQGGEILIPKMPTTRVVDLAEAIAPECRVEVVGIRLGEKLHEVLITEEEAERALEFDDYFLIKPQQLNGWNGGKWPAGRKVPRGFRYSSDQNPWTLSVKEIKALLEEMGYVKDGSL